ncbi:MAG: hypothetical protein WC637_00055 [Victivallales bacterium]|jgi:hypothetical protein
MLNWKTTLFGFLAALPQLINFITPAIPEPWGGLASSIAIIIAFYFAKDKEVKSATVGQ